MVHRLLLAGYIKIHFFMNHNMYHRIAPAVAPGLADDAKKAIQNTSGMFPFLVGLTAEDRKRLQAMDVANKAFTEDAYEAAQNHTEVLPAYLSVAAFKDQLDGFAVMDAVIAAVGEFYDKLRDTRLVMGAAAYQTARSLYRFLGQAAKDGVPGAEAAYLQLSTRFKGQGRGKGKGGQKNSKDA